MSTLILVKGLADVAVAVILVLKPDIIYNSLAARAVGQLSGLVSISDDSVTVMGAWLTNCCVTSSRLSQHLSSASTAPGFNHSIACMVAAVGVGHVVSSRGGKDAWRSVRAFSSFSYSSFDH